MGSSLAQYIGGSNISRSGKSSLMKFYEGFRDGAVVVSPSGLVKNAGTVIRQGGESMLVGGTLGALHGMHPKGLDAVQDIPGDAVIAGVALAAAAVTPNASYNDELRNVGAAAIAVFSFRKTAALVAAKKAQMAVSGESDMGDEDDELIAAARAL